MNVRMGTKAPHSIDSERAVLGTMLSDSATVQIVMERLTEDDFDSSKHRMIFRAIKTIHNKGVNLDLGVLCEELKRRNELTKIGSPDFLARLEGHVLSGQNIEQHIQVVLDKARLRQIIQTAYKAIEQAESEKYEPEKILVDTQRLISEISQDHAAVIVEMPAQDSRTFPYEIMTGVAGDFAEVYSACLEPPKEFFYLSLLTILGNILADKLTIATQIHPQSRFYTLLLGESADDRKSTAISTTVDFVEQLIDRYASTEFDGFHFSPGVGSAEGLLKLFKKHSHIVLIFDEFSQFVSKAKIDTSVLLQCVNTLYENNAYSNATKQSIQEVKGVYLSVLGASTSATYQRTWNPAMTDVGFTNRLFICPAHGSRKHALPKEVAPEEVARLQGDVIKLFNIVRNSEGQRLKMVFTPEALKLYEEWYFKRPESIHGRRLDTYALRFVSLIALSDSKTDIDVDTIQKTLALINWEYEMRKLHDPIDADNAVAKMETSICRQLDKRSLTNKELKDKVHAHRSGLWCFSAAIRNLESEKEIRFSRNRWALTGKGLESLPKSLPALVKRASP